MIRWPASDQHNQHDSGGGGGGRGRGEEDEGSTTRARTRGGGQGKKAARRRAAAAGAEGRRLWESAWSCALARALADLEALVVWLLLY